MHGSRYWTDGDWEYTFLVPQDNINESDKGKLLAVLQKFEKALYVRSDSNSSGWEEVRKTAEMPELENEYGKTGWTLSSEQNILSGNGVLANLEEKLETAKCSCSFMVINDAPEKENDGNSDVDLEAEDSEKPTLDEPSQQTEKVEKKSGKEKKKKKQKSKKSNKVQVGQSIQTRTINSLKDRKKSQEASAKQGLTTYKVVSKPNNGKHNIKSAWNKIGDFIKTQAETYKNVKPIGYGTKKHWHSWHKSWVEKVFVQDDKTKFWLMKLNETLATELRENLDKLGFTIENYAAGNSQGTKPTISNESKPEDTEIKSSGETGTAAEKPTGNRTSNVRKTTLNRKPPQPPNNKEQVTEISQQINENISRDEKKPLPEKSKSSTSTSKPESELKNDFLKDIRTGTKLKETPKETKQKIDVNREDGLVSQMRKVMETRRKDIADDEEPVEGDKNHAIMKVLTEQAPGIYIAMLQLTAAYSEIKKELSCTALCPQGTGRMWLTNTKNGQYTPKSDITNKIDAQSLEECVITGKDGPQGWYVKVITEVESDGWTDDEGEESLLPSVTQMEALLAMHKNVSDKGARLVSISTPLPELKPLVKNPPPLPQRKVTPAPKPKGFVTLDSLKPKPNNRNVKTLVLVKYDDIRTAKNLGMDFREKLSKSTRKYEAFDVNKANKTLSDFKNGTLIGARGMRTATNYRTVLENPVVDNYKNDTLYSVELWNLEIPEDTTDVDIARLRDELAKCGIAIRKDWKRSKV